MSAKQTSNLAGSSSDQRTEESSSKPRGEHAATQNATSDDEDDGFFLSVVKRWDANPEGNVFDIMNDILAEDKAKIESHDRRQPPRTYDRKIAMKMYGAMLHEVKNPFDPYVDLAEEEFLGKKVKEYTRERFEELDNYLTPTWEQMDQMLKNDGIYEEHYKEEIKMVQDFQDLVNSELKKATQQQAFITSTTENLKGQIIVRLLSGTRLKCDPSGVLTEHCKAFKTFSDIKDYPKYPKMLWTIKQFHEKYDYQEALMKKMGKDEDVSTPVKSVQSTSGNKCVFSEEVLLRLEEKFEALKTAEDEKPE